MKRGMNWLKGRNWYPLARREATLLFRSRGTWIFVLLLLVVFLVASSQSADMGASLGNNDGAAGFQDVIGPFVPVGAAFLCYRSVIGERETGCIALTVAMPMRRGDLLLGKVFGRATVLCVATGLVIVAGTICSLVRFGAVSPGPLVGITVLSLMYVVVTVSIVTAISAALRTGPQVIGATFGYAFGMGLVWDYMLAPLLTGLLQVLNPDWSGDVVLLTVRRATPTGSYYVLTNWLFGYPNAGEDYRSLARNLRDPSLDPVAVQFVFETPPAYFAEPVGLLVWIVWAGGLLSVAYWRLTETDLLQL